eukprot:263872_1
MGLDLSLPLERNWITNLLISPQYRIVILVIVSIQLFILPNLLIIHIYRLWKHKNDNIHNGAQIPDYGKLSILRKIIHITTILAITFSIISNIISILNVGSIISKPSICRPIAIIQSISWSFTKLAIYQV